MKLTHIRLLVPDVRDCFLFYRDKIGFEVRYGDESTPFAEFQTGDTKLALEPQMGSKTTAVRTATEAFSGRDQVALILSVDDIDAEYERLKGLGVPFIEVPHDTPEWGHRVAYLRDPAGNVIELNQGI